MTTFNVTGVDDTGATDVTAGILSFIAGCADGTLGSPNTILFGLNKTYRIDGTFRLFSRNHLIVDGNGSTFQTDSNDVPDGHRSGFQIDLCTHIRWTNAAYRGPNVNAGVADAAYDADYEFQHAIEIRGSTNIEVDHNTISKVWGDMVSINAYIPAQLGCQFLEIHDNQLISNGRQGFAFNCCKDVEVHHNVTGECRRSMMDFEPNGATFPLDNVNVHHNTFGQHRLSFMASKGYPGPVNNITVSDNTCWDMGSEIHPTGYGIRQNWTITNNTTNSTGTAGFGNGFGAAMLFWYVDGLTITGNTVLMQPGRHMYLARTIDCTGLNITGNTVTNGDGQYFTQDSPPVGSDPTDGASDDFAPPEIVGTPTTQATFTTSMTITLPTGSAAGDTCIAFIGHYHGNTDFTPLLDPKWVVRQSIILGPDTTKSYFVTAVRPLEAADITAGNFTFTFYEGSVTFRSVGILTTLRDIGSVEPDDSQFVEYQATNGAIVRCIGATTVVPNSLVLFFPAQKSGNGEWTSADGLTILAQRKNNSSAGIAAAVAATVYSGVGKGQDRIFQSKNTSRLCGTTIAFRGIGVPSTGGGGSGVDRRRSFAMGYLGQV